METVPNTFDSLFAGYTVIWVLLVGYMFCLAFRVRRLEKRSSDSSGANNTSTNDR